MFHNIQIHFIRKWNRNSTLGNLHSPVPVKHIKVVIFFLIFYRKYQGQNSFRYFTKLPTLLFLSSFNWLTYHYGSLRWQFTLIEKTEYEVKMTKLFFKEILHTITLGNNRTKAKFPKLVIFVSPYDDNRTIAAKQ